MQVKTHVSSTAGIYPGLTTPGSVYFSLSYTFDDEVVDTQTAKSLLECVTQNILADSAKDHADVIARYARDEELQTDSQNLVHFRRSITEGHGDNAFSISMDCITPFDVPTEAHLESLAVVEQRISDHARAHLLNPALDDVRADIEKKLAAPGTHLVCVLKNHSLRKLISSGFSGCPLAQDMIDTIVPEEAMSFPEIEQYAKSTDEGLSLEINVVGLDEPQETGYGQYL